MDKKLFWISLFSIFWAIYTIISKFILREGIHPLNLSVHVLFFSTILLLSLILISGQNQIFQFKEKYQKGSILIGLLAGMGEIIAQYGLHQSTASNFGFIIKTSAGFGIILAFYFLKEPLSKIKLLLTVFMFIGVYLISTKGQGWTPHFGDVLILIAAFINASTTTINKFVTSPKRNLKNFIFNRSFYAFLIAGVFCGISGNFSFISDFKLISLIFINAILLILISYSLNKNLEVASASYATMMSMLLPVFVLILSTLFLSEHFNLIQIIGGFIVIVAGIVTQKAKVAHHS